MSFEQWAMSKWLLAIGHWPVGRVAVNLGCGVDRGQGGVVRIRSCLLRRTGLWPLTLSAQGPWLKAHRFCSPFALHQAEQAGGSDQDAVFDGVLVDVERRRVQIDLSIREAGTEAH